MVSLDTMVLVVMCAAESLQYQRLIATSSVDL
jgi:quercetin dioxygenase-like cupin family protein